MTDSVRRDVFVSYRHIDPTMTWVRTVLVPAIEASHLSVILDQRELLPGDGIVEMMERASDGARITLAVVDEDYAGSGFTDLERWMADRLVVVIRDPTRLESFPQAQATVDLVGNDDPAPV